VLKILCIHNIINKEIYNFFFDVKLVSLKNTFLLFTINKYDKIHLFFFLIPIYLQAKNYFKFNVFEFNLDA